MLVLLKRHFMRYTTIQKEDISCYIKCFHLITGASTLQKILDNNMRDRLLLFFYVQYRDLGVKEFQIMACKLLH